MPEARLVARRRRARSARSSSAPPRRRAPAERIAFRGALSRDEALRIVAGAEAALLSSDWENLPHSAVEALSVGVPVVVDGRRRRARGRARRRERPARAARPAGRARGRDPPHRSTSRACASGSPRRRSRRWRRSRATRSTAGSRRCSRRRRDERRSRACSSSAACATSCRCRPGWRRSGTRSSSELDYRVVGAAVGGQRAERRPLPARRRRSRPHLLDGFLFYLRLPFRVRTHIRDFRPEAIFASDPVRRRGRRSSGARWPGGGAPVIVEVHGDWRTFARALRLAFAAADRAGRRRAAPRARSGAPTRRAPSRPSPPSSSRRCAASPPSAVFTAFSDLSAFTERPPAPLPERPTVVFVGSLEPYKNIDGLGDAWRLVADAAARRRGS